MRDGWFVVQVQTGREHAMCKAIERACKGKQAADGSPLLRECFSPVYIHRLKYHGEWRDVEQRLLPGYVLAVTSDPLALAHAIMGIREFSRMLTMAETIVPLREDERAWIEKWTESGNRVVPISVGYRKGDTLVVTEGPLKGREAMVIRVIRKKCIAVLEVHAGNTRILTELGLALLPEGEAVHREAADEVQPG